MAIHILGNGPSIRLFDRSAWPESDVFVGCNFSDTALRPDYTVIVDIRAMRQFRGGVNGYKLEIPAVITQRAYDYIDKDTKGWHTMAPDRVRIKEIIPLIRDTNVSKSLAMNSGQHGVIYALKQNPSETQVHLWGCDSLWSNDLTSLTDKIVKRTDRSRVKPNVTAQWNGYWTKIIADNPGVNFYIHKPKAAGNILLSLPKLFEVSE